MGYLPSYHGALPSTEWRVLGTNNVNVTLEPPPTVPAIAMEWVKVRERRCRVGSGKLTLQVGWRPRRSKRCGTATCLLSPPSNQVFRGSRRGRQRLWPRAKARSHTADVFDQLIILLVGGLGHSSRIAGCAFHDGVMYTDNEHVYLSQGVLWDLILQSIQGGMDMLEASMKLALDCRRAKRGINN